MAPLRKTQRDAADRRARRASGTLENAVLTVLWEARRPLNAAEVRERLLARNDGGSGELAYTTIVTILARLHEKNALSRERDGRAFRYSPVADEAGLAARRLSAMLDTAADRHAVLSRFIEDLSEHDEQVLRAVLDARPEPAAAADDVDAG
jgi:predicted transcriptional regulator